MKTRLAKTLGDEMALAIYLKLINHTQNVVKAVDADVAVYYSDYVDTEDNWNNAYIKKRQHGKDLGEKMFNAISAGLNMGYASVCLVGTDIYELTPGIIDGAFDKLNKSDVVIGPARDGGYYLIGMTRPDAKVFDISAWSTSSVLEETLLRVQEQGLGCAMLEALGDIDTEEDLQGTNLCD
ncbi:MAG: TIGR04282 family arsenosugar biosynthesis glycosyltransferase [Cytophagales bacterium]|nr:TIGR04282 family arsenosugar biosynthesis glycosyltransferase [Cytophagales bacterium]